MRHEVELRALWAALADAVEQVEWLRGFNAAHGDCLASRLPRCREHVERGRDRLNIVLKTTTKNRKGTP